MRWLLSALMLLAGCSSDALADAPNAGGKTCATTSCVAGASCVTKPGGVRCTCYETGVWTCGDIPLDPGDGGFEFDSTPSYPEPTDATSGFDAFISGGVSVDVKECGTVDACMIAEDDPVRSAEVELARILTSCGATCGANVMLQVSAGGCPVRVLAKSKSEALYCVAGRVGDYRWPCGKEFRAGVLCPD